MTVDTFLEQFAHLAEAPNGLSKLRELILQLAVRGKLVPQDPEDKPISTGEEASEGLASSWRLSPLGDVLEIQNGYAFKSRNFNEVGEGLPLIRIRDIMNDATEVHCSEEYRDDYLVEHGDILIGMDGNFNVSRWRGDRALLNQRVCKLQKFSGEILPDFVLIGIQEHLDRIRSQSKNYMTVQHLSAKQIRSIRFPFPPLAEQKRIVAKVEELMALCDDLEAKQQAKRIKRIALNRASLHALTEPNGPSLVTAWHRVRDHFDHLYTSSEIVNELRQNILQLAVMGRLVPQDPNDEPASEVSMEELVGQENLQNGLSLKETSSSTPYRCLRLSALRNGVVDCDNAKPIPLTPDRASKYLVAQGNVFVVRGNGSKNLMGRAGIVECQPDGLIFPDLFIRIPLDGDRLLARYFLIAWNSPKTRGTIERLAKTTSGIWKVNQGHVASVVLRIPSRSEQERIIGKVDQLMTLCDNLEAKLQQTQTGADNLLTAIVHELVGRSEGESQACP